MAKLRNSLLQSAHRQRGTWHVPADSVINHWYEYWRSRSNAPRRKENLCHYGRVLIFWAPLYFLRDAVKWPHVRGRNRYGVVYLAALAIIIALFSDLVVALWVIGVIGTIAYAAFSFVVGLYLYEKRYGLDEVEFPTLPLRLVVPCTVLASPSFLLVAAIVIVFAIPVTPLYFVLEVWKIPQRIFEAIIAVVTLHPKRLPWLQVWWVAPIGPIVYLLVTMAHFRLVMMWIGLALLGIAALIAVILGCMFIAFNYYDAIHPTGDSKHWENLYHLSAFQDWLADKSDGSDSLSLRRSYFHLLPGEWETMKGLTLDQWSALEYAFITDYLGHSIELYQPRPFTRIMNGFLTALELLVAPIVIPVQLIMLVGSALWAAKIKKMCPMIEIDEPNTTPAA